MKKSRSSLLIGVTGGIAGGKTTVADMLKELGAHLIDFDVLARQVVEPGKPAWKEIVDYFGGQVLNEDNCLDRKRLSTIVFQDFEKRKKLERITHPRIHEAFERQAIEIEAKHPRAIIQVVVPLLFEVKMQDLFHKILLVYLPSEKQIERLCARDGISRREAANILQAQLPIDEKVKYADFIINNANSLEETREQVEKLWESLKTLQRKRLA